MAVVDRANERLEAKGLPSLPDGLSPHALRRSFISWLIHEGEDVAYVMEQAGHEDSKMTLEIYARAIRNGRRTVRSQRRLAALSERAVEQLDRAPLGSSALGGAAELSEEAAA